MAHCDMTIAEILRDPLIRMMMRADGVTLAEMGKLLQDAVARARRRHDGRAKALPPPRAGYRSPASAS